MFGPLASLLNRGIRRSTDATRRCRELDGRSFRIELDGLNLGLTLLARGDLEWDPDTGSTQRSVFGLYYRPQNGLLLNASYRMRRELPNLSAPGLTESMEQIDLSGVVPLGRNSSARASWAWVRAWLIASSS